MKKIGILLVMVSFIVGFGVSKALAVSLSGSDAIGTLYDSIAAGQISLLRNSAPRNNALGRYRSAEIVITNPADRLASLINRGINEIVKGGVIKREDITPDNLAKHQISTDDGFGGVGTTTIEAEIGTLITALVRELELPPSVKTDTFTMQFIDAAL